jgi:hypothetical protein
MEFRNGLRNRKSKPCNTGGSQISLQGFNLTSQNKESCVIISVRLQSLMASAIVLSFMVTQSPTMTFAQVAEPASQAATDSASSELSPQRQLQHARKAMQESNFPLAQHFIETAEVLVKQSAGAIALPYTPEMARQELAALQAGAKLTEQR